jgi:SAM-dependent methyltransferase
MSVLKDLEFGLHWHSDGVTHEDYYYATALTPAHVPDVISLPSQPHPIITIAPSQFKHDFSANIRLEPRLGRFYPATILHNVAEIHPQDKGTALCVGIDPLRFDLNHPLAGYPVTLSTREFPTTATVPSTAQNWSEKITLHGPGMQACRFFAPDYWHDNPFQRHDKHDDTIFYTRPRFIQHLDRSAIARITELYQRLLQPHTRILDLMSSWVSHIPQDLALEHVYGLGLNAEELAKNPRLQQRCVHDLNQNPRLPYADNFFDSVICTASVEYLIEPFAVFADLARVVKPGGLVIMTFSNRWFPPKAIKLWGELHEFERMRLVLEYFRHEARFENLHTYSLRPLPRPPDDAYARRLPYADPVYALWGTVSL